MSNRIANLVFRAFFLSAFIGLVIMIAMPFGADPVAWSIWWDILIVFAGICVYDIIFKFFGVKIHITDKYGIIKWTIKGGY